MKKNEYILIALIVVTIILAIIFWPKKPKNITMPGEADSSGGGNGGANGGGGGAASGFPIQKGAINEYVKNVQKAINHSWAYYGNGNKRLVEDGNFGSQTIAALDSFGFQVPEVITLSRYNWIMARYNAQVPLGRRYTQDNIWPIQMGEYDTGASNRIKKINIGLGIYPFNTNDPTAHEFTKQTKAALLLKARVGSVSEQLYNNMLPAFKWAPTMYIN